MFNRPRIALTCAAAFLSLTACAAQPAPEAELDRGVAFADSVREAPVLGLWVWHEEQVNDYAEQDQLIAFCQEQGINRILMQVHHDAATSPTPKLKYPEQLARLVETAGAAGIVVEALDGGPNQADADQQDRSLAVLQMVLDFNRELDGEHRLAGVHYDIEPYVRPEWQDLEQRQVIMRDLLTFFVKAKQLIADDPDAAEFLLASDIPMWYDALGEEGTLTFDGKTQNLHRHIQDICDYIGIMSYRTHAIGENSVAYHIEAEVEYAASIGKVACGALETLELPESPQITFYGGEKQDFLDVLEGVQTEYADHDGFGGMFIHYYLSARDLLK